MAESAPEKGEAAVAAREGRALVARAVGIAAKVFGLLIAAALLAAITDPVWVTDHVLLRIFPPGYPPLKPTAPAPSPEFIRIYTSVKEQAIAAHVERLSGLGSRVPGYPGAEKAFDYIKGQVVGTKFWVTELDKGDTVQVERTLGVGPDRDLVREEAFDVTVPVDEGARLTLLGPGDLEGRTVTLHCLWPNAAQTPCLPREGITGPLMDAGRGYLHELNEDVDGTIALVDFACDQRYVNLRMLGAKAIIFYASADGSDTEPGINLSQALDKMLVVPADIPRYYVGPKGSRLLARLVEKDALPKDRTRSRAERLVRLQARMAWKTVRAKNLIVELPGSMDNHPRLEGAWRDQRIIVSAFYDSISVVPAVAPGAENACSVASALEMLKALAQWKERSYTVTFLFTGAHFQGMAGINAWLARHARKNKTFRREMQIYVITLKDGKTVRGRIIEEQPERDDRVVVELPDGSRKTIPAADIHGVDRKYTSTHKSRDLEHVVTLTDRKTLRGRIVEKPRGKIVLLEDASSGVDDAAAVRTTIRRANIESIDDESNEVPFKVFIGLDLSSRNGQVAAFSEGAFTNPLLATNNYRKNALAPFAKTLTGYHDDTWQELAFDTPETRYAEARYFNAITPPKRSWKNFMPVPLGFEHEAVHRVGGVAFTLATPTDRRALVDTPLDTFARLTGNIGNVTRQAQTVTALLMKATHDPEFFPESKLVLPDDAGSLEGRVVWFDRDVNFFVPKAPISGGLVAYQMNGWTEASCAGVRTFITTMTSSGRPQRRLAAWRGMIGDGHGDHDAFTNQEDAGRFVFTIRRVQGDTDVEAYAFDDAGRIVFAPDLGEEGDKNYPVKVTNSSGVSNTTAVLFPCRAISIFEIVDSRRLSALDSLTVLTPSDAEPQWYGMKFVPDQSTKEGRTVPAAVIFVKPDQRVKLFMSTGLFGIKYLLTGTDEALLDTLPAMEKRARISEALDRASTGRGYNPAESVIFHPFYKAARDMWIVDDVRIKRMARYGIRNERLDRLHTDAWQALAVARQARDATPPNYPVYVAASRQAWGLEARGYPDVKRTASDSVNGIIFYFMLLLPFSFFGERLLFGFRDIRARMGGVAGLFAVVFILLHLVHPAFKLTTSPYIILLAFVVLVLGLIVLVLLMGKFGEQVRKSKRAASGMHEVDVGRISATTAAINLGVDNLRKRKVRTTLTAVTLILLTFTVLSFTSIQTSLRPFVLPHRRDPLYDGALIRGRSWGALQQSKLVYVESTFGVSTYEEALKALGGEGAGEAARVIAEAQAYRRWQAAVVPRAWIQAKVKGDKEFIQVRNEANGRSASAFGIVGLTPDERRIIGKALDGDAFAQLGLVDADGHPVWIEEDERDVCFLSKHMASDTLLDIEPDAVGRLRVWMYGRSFLVKGIFDGDVFDTILDLDGEPLTPVDFVKEASEVAQAQKEDPSRQAAQPIRQFEHIDAKNCVIIPYGTARNLGGLLSSIALVDFHLAGSGPPPPSKQTWLTAVEHFMDRVALTVFVGDTKDGPEGSVNVWSSISRTGVGRIANLLVPIIIAAFIVLNTMIGSVYERAREIGIYSAIGLTPKHIAALFLAESAVFATVGAVMGYLMGQILVRILDGLGVLEGSGMTLNYSSLSAIWSTVVVMLTTFLSTIYPARKAAELSVPDVTRRWKFPEPSGDDWFFDFPFTLGGAEVPGIYSYLARVFESYGEGSVGGFLTEEVRLSAAAHELGPKYTITMKTWLAPYDLGISQSVRMEAIPTGEANIYRIALSLHRESGDVASWRRINRGFLNVLRKRFLVWRTMAPGLREEYHEQGQELTELAASVTSEE